MSYTNENVNPPTNFGVGNFETANGQIDWQGNWMDQMREGEGSALAKMPYQIGEQYNKIAQYGIYGQNGVQNIQNSVQQANLLRMRSLSKGLMQNQGRRLGPRSLGANTAVMNQVYAPGMAQTAQTHAGLLQENMQSKMKGIQGMESIMRFMQQRHGAEWWKKAKKSKGGFMGFMKNALKVAQFIPGPQQPFVAGANASVNGGEAFSMSSGGDASQGQQQYDDGSYYNNPS